MKNLKLLSATLIGLATFVSLQAASPWSVRIAATYVQTVDGSTNKAINVDVQDKLIPEFDVCYAFDSHWSAELVLTVPQEHNVKVNGAKAGNFKELPPTLLGKYTFDPIGGFTPYVGAGINATLIYDTNLLGGAAKLDNYSFGPAGQIGCDYKINDRWSLNLDLKRIYLRSDVTVGGAKVTEARLDPWLYSVGLRYQF